MTKKKRAASVPFSQELFDEICERIAGGESLRKITKDEDMPTMTSVFRWLADSKPLSEQYARSRAEQADAIFDECLAIADQYDKDADNGEGGVDHIQRARLRIDTRKWMAGKLRPKKYGEKLDVTSGGKRIEGISVGFVDVPRAEDG